MLKLKRLDTFILGKFLQLFVGAFFICLFVMMMQFLWRWTEELAGKGLTAEMLAQFFWYVAITLVPTTLPLAVLLASLITFGNMGESLELLSMKAAGVPLIRIMRPIIYFVVPLSMLSFVFLNSISPDAQRSLMTLLSSIKISQPALQIPEGIFYNGIPNTNIYVERKNPETGMLYRTIIYKTDQGFERAQIVLADSAKLEMTADKLHLRLTLWSGEQFQNLKSDNISVFSQESAPYDRETFAYKQILIDFDSNMAQLDQEIFSSMPKSKGLAEIYHDIDSMHHVLDSSALAYFNQVMARHSMLSQTLSKKDSLKAIKSFRAHPIGLDQLMAKAAPDQLQRARMNANSRLQALSNELDWQSELVEDQEHYIRLHRIEQKQKFTIALAALLFFFVGAPLGAIIRKGGLGMPTVISVAIFIVYYLIDISGMKSARSGAINLIVGTWLSTFALIPAGVYLTYMANRDSTVFNLEAYLALLRRLLGIRTRRNLVRKEVIIHEPDYATDAQRLQTIKAQAESYLQANRLLLAPNYFRIFFRSKPDAQIEALSDQLEDVVQDLANTTSPHILQQLNTLPVLHVHSHCTPFARKRYNWTFGVIFPLGLLLWLRIWQFRLRLRRDLRQIIKTADQLHPLLSSTSNNIPL